MKGILFSKENFRKNGLAKLETTIEKTAQSISRDFFDSLAESIGRAVLGQYLIQMGHHNRDRLDTQIRASIYKNFGSLWLDYPAKMI